MKRRILGHVALVVAGLAVVIWAVVTLANPVIDCRGVRMGPGDVCHNAEGTKVQTYEQRLDAMHGSMPIMVGAGLLIAGFGASLAVADLRRAGSWGRTRPDRPPAA